MKVRYRFFLTALTAAGILFFTMTGTTDSAPDSGRGLKAGHAVVKVHPQQQVQDIVAKVSGAVIDSIPGISTYLIDLPDEVSTEEILNSLSTDPLVVYATVNTSVELPEINQVSQAFPDQQEPVYSKGVAPPEFYASPGVYLTGLDSALTIATGQSATIAIIDNGLAVDHPFISAAKIKAGYDYIDDDSEPLEEVGLMYGHGTFVTGLILLGAPDCTLMPLRTFDENGVGDQFSVAKALYRAIDRRATVVNMSFGTVSPDIVLQDAINDALAAGLILVASSGNNGAELKTYPAAFEGVIAVNSFNTAEVLAAFSNYGDYIDVCAPGVDLYSALPGDIQWGTWSGTSFSAPLVSATAALIREVHGDMTPSEVQGRLRATARKELLWGSIITPDLQYGYGALDAYLAVLTYSLGDVNHDGYRNELDMDIMIGHVGGTPAMEHSRLFRRLADLNCDGRVDVTDLMIMAQNINNGWINFKSCRE